MQGKHQDRQANAPLPGNMIIPTPICPSYPVVVTQLGGSGPLLGIQMDTCANESCSRHDVIWLKDFIIRQRLLDGNGIQALDVEQIPCA
jgi:hypothetical protein